LFVQHEHKDESNVLQETLNVFLLFKQHRDI